MFGGSRTNHVRKGGMSVRRKIHKIYTGRKTCLSKADQVICVTLRVDERSVVFETSLVLYGIIRKRTRGPSSLGSPRVCLSVWLRDSTPLLTCLPPLVCLGVFVSFPRSVGLPVRSVRPRLSGQNLLLVLHRSPFLPVNLFLRRRPPLCGPFPDLWRLVLRNHPS